MQSCHANFGKNFTFKQVTTNLYGEL